MQTRYQTEQHSTELEIAVTPVAIAATGEIQSFLRDRQDDWHCRLHEATFDFAWLGGANGRDSRMARTILVSAYVAKLIGHLYVDVDTEETVEATGDQLVTDSTESDWTIKGLEDIDAFYHDHADTIGEYADNLVYDNPGGRYR